MADLMDLYNGVGPGVGAMWLGQNQQDKLDTSSMQRAHVQAQIEDQLARLKMAQELQPFEIQKMQAGTSLTQGQAQAQDFTNQVNTGVGVPANVTARAEELKTKVSGDVKTRTQNFLSDVASGTDVDEAIRNHGLDPNAPQAQMLRNMSPKQRKDFYDQYVANNPKNIETRQEEAFRLQKQRELQDAEYRRSIDVQKLKNKGMLEAAQARAQRAEQAKNFQQAAIMYKTAADAALDSGDNATYTKLMNRAWDMQEADFKARQAAAVAPPKPGAVDIGATTEGAVVTNPRQQTPQFREETRPAPGIGESPTGRQLSPADMQAKEWATQNPNDPRSAKILQKLRSEGKL